MKLAKILLFCLLLTGCIVDEYDYRITHRDTVYTGDSLCWKVFDTDTGISGIYENEDWMKTAERMLGIVINCVPGRKTTDIDQLPEGRIGIIAMGTNDVGRTPIDEFRLQYQLLIDSTDYEHLYCVLPNRVILGVDAEPYRQAIREICANVIDPLDYGVMYRAKDTVHMTEYDHWLWFNALKDILEPLWEETV